MLGFVLPVLLGAGLGACGGAPEAGPLVADGRASRPLGPLRLAPPDACEPEPGKAAADPLERVYSGVAAKARCQREVYTIMAGVTGSLGVECQYCHLVPDYRAMTHRKEIANWMASELVPALQKNGGGQAWCNDCHALSGKGVAKILGDPRRPSFAIEWMTTHLVEDFQTQRGSALHCNGCHHGNLGTPEFLGKIILTNNLPTN